MSGEIVSLKTQLNHQNTSLVSVEKVTSKLSSHCPLLPADICGKCQCMDDDRLQQKFYCNCQNTPPQRDCLELLHLGYKTSGLYKIKAGGIKEMQVFCDMQQDGGGWTVFQRRLNGERNFYLDWQSYKKGFGEVQREFWLGNDNLYVLTLQAAYPKGSEMRVDMQDWDDKSVYAKYSSFSVDNENAKYKLHVGGYSGNAGDSFGPHNGYKFSTYDQDNDVNPGSCSRNHRGAWWYNSCHSSNLNGEYRWFDVTQPGYARGVIWFTYTTHERSLKYVEMKVRRKI